VYFAAEVEMSGEKRAAISSRRSSVPAKGKFFKKTTSVNYFIQTSRAERLTTKIRSWFRGNTVKTDAIPATVTVDILPCFERGFLNAAKVAPSGSWEWRWRVSIYCRTTSKRPPVRNLALQVTNTVTANTATSCPQG
ncbi:hypothetical protein BV898_18246, partial [Hypsibius exemplaris]